MPGKHILAFLQDKSLKRNPSSVKSFWSSDKHDIPRKPGVYVLIAKKGIKFLYPAGKSSIYYIGQTSSLRKRIVEQHRKYHNHVRDNRRLSDCIYEARHEYGGVYGGRYCFIETWPNITPKSLEKMVIRAFIKRFYAPPVANGAGAWGWVSR
jgi:hypothetical protein